MFVGCRPDSVIHEGQLERLVPPKADPLLSGFRITATNYCLWVERRMSGFRQSDSRPKGADGLFKGKRLNGARQISMETP